MGHGGKEEGRKTKRDVDAECNRAGLPLKRAESARSGALEEAGWCPTGLHGPTRSVAVVAVSPCLLLFSASYKVLVLKSGWWTQKFNHKETFIYLMGAAWIKYNEYTLTNNWIRLSTENLNLYLHCHALHKGHLLLSKIQNFNKDKLSEILSKKTNIKLRQASKECPRPRGTWARENASRSPGT